MKIDESCINHNVVVLLKEITSNAEETVFVTGKDKDSYAELAYLWGYARGVIEMADALKEVLKA